MVSFGDIAIDIVTDIVCLLLRAVLTQDVKESQACTLHEGAIFLDSHTNYLVGQEEHLISGVANDSSWMDSCDNFESFHQGLQTEENSRTFGAKSCFENCARTLLTKCKGSGNQTNINVK